MPKNAKRRLNLFCPFSAKVFGVDKNAAALKEVTIDENFTAVAADVGSAAGVSAIKKARRVSIGTL